MNAAQKLDTMRALLIAAMKAAEQAHATLEAGLIEDNEKAAQLEHGEASELVDDDGETLTPARFTDNRVHSIAGAALCVERDLEAVRTLLESLKTIHLLPVRR